jgi:ring-1,2-phenylacetyl-CoA epoxidase subunit PaaC
MQEQAAISNKSGLNASQWNWKTAWIIHLADDSLILGHRNSEWTGHGPILEQDIAISNIALDLIGQARNFYQYAATLLPGLTEDDLAYWRDAWDFRNCLLVEQSNGDWAKTILRQFLFSSFQYFLYEELQQGKDEIVAAIGAKSLKEVAYHLSWSAEWVIRLGDGSEESHRRILEARDDLWKFTDELFRPATYESEAAGAGERINLHLIKEKWRKRIQTVFEQATISVPEWPGALTGGKTGIHSEQLGFILAEMQYVQRTYPGSNW